MALHEWAFHSVNKKSHGADSRKYGERGKISNSNCIAFETDDWQN